MKNMNIIDMHCDTMYQIYERKREGKTIAVRDDANLHVTLEKMKQGGYLLQNFAAFVELEESKEQLANEVEDIKLAPYQFARHLIDTFKTQTEANQDLIGVVPAPLQIFRAMKRKDGCLRCSPLRRGASA